MDTRTAPDPATVAFIAIGAHEALRKARHISGSGRLTYRAVDLAYERHEGQLGFISEVISHALHLDQLAEEAGHRLAGCFAYEVAEPFGETYADALIAQTGETPESIAARLVAACCAEEDADR